MRVRDFDRTLGYIFKTENMDKAAIMSRNALVRYL